MTINETDKVLDFAILCEEQAVEFYTRLAEKASKQPVKKVFLEFADEERGHKAKLEEIKSGKQLLLTEDKVSNLGLAEQIDDESVRIHEGMDYQQALIIAMKAEKAAFKLYTGMAAECDNPAIKEVLLGLAQEEAKHKLRFEIEYDEYVLREN